MSEKSPNAGSVNDAAANDQGGSTAAFNPGDLLASWAAETDSTEAPAATSTGAAAAPARPIEQKHGTGNTTTSLKPRSHRALRMGISLPVEVQHPTGTREQSQTVFVLARGAVISLTNAVIVGQKLTLKNLKNGKVVECRVLSVDRGLKGTFQTELEFTEVIPEFWPVHFPSEDYGHSESHGRSGQPAPVSSPSLQSHIESRPTLTTPAPISPSFDKPAASSKPVELVPLAGSLAGQKAEPTPALESPVTQNKTPVPGTYSTSDVRVAELAASSVDNKAASRKTPVPGTHTINDFRRVEAAPSVELKVRNTPLPGAYTTNDVHAMELKGSGVEIKVRNTPVPGTYSVNDFRTTETPVARPHSTAYSHSHAHQRRTETASSGGGMKWMALCAAVVLIATGALLAPKFLHRTGTPAHTETASGPAATSPAAEKLTVSEPPATVTPEAATSNAQTSVPTLQVEEPQVETTNESKGEAKLEAKSETKPEARSEAKSTSTASHQATASHQPTTKQAKSSEEHREVAIVKQTGAMSTGHRQAPVSDEPDPAPVISGGDSALVANSQPPTVLTGIAAPPATVSAPRTVSHIKGPRLITATPPQYPAIAKQNRIQGDVTIEMDIDANGNVSSAKVVSGPPFLQAAAKDAVRRWKYEPATLNDNPIPYHMQVRVHFALQ